MQVAAIISRVVGPDVPVRVIGYDGSKAGPDSSDVALRITSPRALARLATAPGTLGLARAYVEGEIEVDGDLYQLLDAMADVTLDGVPAVGAAPAGGPAAAAVAAAPAAAAGPGVPPAGAAALQVPRPQGDLAPLRRVQPLLRVGARAVDGLHLRGVPDDTATLEEAQAAKYELVAQKLALEPGMRLLDVGCGWGGMVMHAAAEHGVKALGVTLSRNQAEWAQAEIVRRGLQGLAEVRHLDYRDAPESEFDAISSIGLTEHIGNAQLPAYFGSLHARLRPGGRLLNHCITQPRTPQQGRSTRSSTGTCSRTASWRPSGASSAR